MSLRCALLQHKTASIDFHHPFSPISVDMAKCKKLFAMFQQFFLNVRCFLVRKFKFRLKRSDGNPANGSCPAKNQTHKPQS